MRLIDADAVLEHFADYWAMLKKLKRPSKQQHAQYMTMRSIVNSLKTEDAVPVIRCKYCKHSEPWYRDRRRCFLWNENGIDVFDDGYCNYGKIKAEREEE